ncbi:hypothetical protein C8Q78DRAFT_1146321 [Trametes maxima]|nr:hypothetical protein C8Q78DRAFT_1146321 [Trametes maxima]
MATASGSTPRVRVCNWNWCPETFRDGTALAKHLHQVHFTNLVKVKKRDWEAYLRSCDGRSGDTGPSDSFPVNPPSSSSVQASIGDHHADGYEPSNESSQQPLPPPSTPRTIPPLPRNLSRAHAASQLSPAASQNITITPVHSPVLLSTPHKHPTPDPSPGSSSHTRSAKRRRTSFADYAAQSSPMSTPSVASMPPSPPLSNMITDAINAAGRLNAGSPNDRLSPRTKPRSAGSAKKAGTVLPLPRRTSFGASPTPDRSRAHPQARVPVTPTMSTTGSFGAADSHTHIRSPGLVSVGSAQAVEDALTQHISAETSPAASQPGSTAGSLQYSSQSSGGSQQSHQSLSQHQQQSGDPYYGSHAVDSLQSFLLTTSQLEESSLQANGASASGSASSGSQLRSNPAVAAVAAAAAASQSQSPEKIKPTPPLPRTRRARSKTPAVAPPLPPAPTPVPAGGRTLRSRSKTPAPALAPASQTQTLQLPRRTTRSRASSATGSAGEGAKRAGSTKPPVPSDSENSGKGARLSSRARSASRSKSRPPSSSMAAGQKETQNSGGLAPVDEQAEQDATQPPALPPPPPSQYQPQSQSQSQNGFRSGTIHIPLPRRNRLRAGSGSGSSSGSQTESQAPASQAQAQAASPVKREPDAEPTAMDVDGPAASQMQTQGTGYGYVEGYGFDMSGMVLQTQTPYSWSQSQSQSQSQSYS